MTEEIATRKIMSILKPEDAVTFLALSLKQNKTIFQSYGYDVYIPNVIRDWYGQHCSEIPKPSNWNSYEFPLHNVPYLSKTFYGAAWELCRLGVLRPGVGCFGAQSTDGGNAGDGYSLTPFGLQWLEEISDQNIFVTTEPGRFSEMLAPHASVFGDGFRNRAIEAIRCYGAHAYLACCAMCGAAAESILLNLAIKKDGDEEKVLKAYRSANGRKRLEDFIISEQKEQFKNDFQSGFILLKYWRDESAHGRPSMINENEGYTSLGLLLRCAQFAKDNYSLLTEQKKLPSK